VAESHGECAEASTRDDFDLRPHEQVCHWTISVSHGLAVLLLLLVTAVLAPRIMGHSFDIVLYGVRRL